MTSLQGQVVKYLINTGSSWAPVNELTCRGIDSAVKNGELVERYKENQRFVTHPFYDSAEKFCAKYVFQKANRYFDVDDNLVDSYIAEFCKLESGRLGFEFRLSDEQAEGVKMFAHHQLAILTGGPGTGKTSVLKCAAFVLRRLQPRHSIALTAPTGKAANRITESTGYFAQTLQSKIGDAGPGSRLKIISEDILMVDEVSMLDLETFEKLLRCMSPYTRCFLVGDVDQLPSVGIGAVLRDLIDSQVVACCQLEQTFRQDAESKLFENIQIIKKGGHIPLIEGSDFVNIRTEKNALELCLSHYLAAVDKYGSDNTAILTPYRKEGTICSEKLNNIIQNKLNPPGHGNFIHTEVTREDGRSLAITFREGDPVIQLKNTGVIANGDIGRIIAIDHDVVSVKYSDCIYKYDCTELDQLDLAYALSIHKSQGSEYACVITPFLRENQNLDRNMIYTAVTRAKKCFIRIGEDKVIQDACKIQNFWNRHTFLCENLEMLRKQLEIQMSIISF